ncbi:argininosuccinate lyase [Aliidiomarina halalkaliphila]|uniref:Argininosuccinate lyase n=1 Tax=Aliidiomarina halalkaliphila TaxID=2593535 RepID=A0A552X467_9GAMM|nr:argininosuccinate lyase [Aliidiomarina halalkaliphila]TRW49785.1 argininosuccinate lyase [Aliidiomarina halalkaliphila]
MSMWGGRFEQASAGEFRAFNDSLKFDYVLAPFDIQASKAWVNALTEQQLLTNDEQEILQSGLDRLLQRVQKDPRAPLSSNEEDIHSWVESELQKLIGSTARKLHTGRSRNDLVATDLRLWSLAKTHTIGEHLLAAIDALLAFAERYEEAVMPGYTHLQRAQPVLVSHWALAYVEMLERDLERLTQARERLSQSPLGCGALAGSGIAVERHEIAAELGFNGPCRNSLDAVSDRDFVIELLATASLSMVHLSRLSEDIVFYCSGEAGLFLLGDAISSGSSLMPQKKNPDVFELIRGKTGRVAGHLQAMLMTVKGLPLAYNKDMQEDKEGYFDGLAQWQQCLAIMAYALPHLRVDTQVAQHAAELGYSNATDLADYLVGQGIPFRDSHELSGKLVLIAIQQGVPLEALTLADMQQVSSRINEDVYAALALMSGMNRRSALGGTAPAKVHSALRRARQRSQAHAAALTHVRQAKLTDVPKIAELIRYWAAKGEHLPRQEQDIMQAIHQFAVAELNGEIVGCGALYVFGTGLAEIRSLGLQEGLQGKGMGAELVNFLLDQARHLGIARVIALTRAPAFFAKLGFTIADKSRWPEKVMKDCEFCPRKHACDETGLEIRL